MDNGKVKETRVMKLDKPVVVRKVPMTAEGCDMLRAIRAYHQELYSSKTGASVEIPFPTAFHLLMTEFVKLKGIPIDSQRTKED